MKRPIHPNSKPPTIRHNGSQDRMPAVPRGWRSKFASALFHRVGTVLTADEVYELALIVGAREAGK